MLVVLATIGVALHVARRSAAVGALALAPAFVLALPDLQSRPRASLVVAGGLLGLASFAWWRVGRAPSRDSSARAVELASPEAPLASPA